MNELNISVYSRNVTLKKELKIIRDFLKTVISIL